MRVVSRRWDQLGGRLNSLTNAAAMAELLGMEMAFTWPPGGPDVEEIFGPRVLGRCLATSDFDGWLGLWRADPRQARSECLALASGGQRAFVEVDAPFGIVAPPGEPPAVSQERFHAAFAQIDWSPALDGSRQFLAQWPGDGRWAGVHVRAGDVVTGEWRRAMWHEKYVPISCLITTVAALCRTGRQVVICSDNEPLARWMARAFPGVVLAGDILPGYADLSAGQRALAEIMLLARCGEVVGPPRSAFSRLAAVLAGGELVRADGIESFGEDLFDRLGAGLEVVRAAARTEPGGRALFAPLLARDLVWSVDVLAGQLSCAERLVRLREATDLDPDFVAAWARRARAAAESGRSAEARRALRRATRAAREERVHDDPRVDIIAASVVRVCLGALSPVASRSVSLARRRLDRARRIRASLTRLRPFTVDVGRLAQALDRLVEQADALAGPGRRVPALAEVRAPLQMPLLGDGPALAAERRGGDGTFDTLSAEIEGLARRLAQIGPGQRAAPTGFEPVSPP